MTLEDEKKMLVFYVRCLSLSLEDPWDLSYLR